MGENYSVLKDISYGNHERHVFDLFIPEKAENKSGVILLIHGGGWSNGDKSDYKNVTEKLLEENLTYETVIQALKEIYENGIFSN